MKDPCCPFEGAVAEAARNERWTAELVEHSQSCLACAEVRLVAGVLLAEARADELDPLPDPGLIWIRSRLEARREGVRRATLAITVVQLLGAAFAGAVGIRLLIWMWPALRQAFVAAGRALTPTALPAGAADPALVILVCGVVIGAMVLRELAIGRSG